MIRDIFKPFIEDVSRMKGDIMANWRREIKLGKELFNVMHESSEHYARIIADEAGFEGEERWLFLERVRQIEWGRDVLSAIGTFTLVITPYVVVKAITK